MPFSGLPGKGWPRVAGFRWTRSTDLIAQAWGKEFAPLATALNVGERLRDAVEGLCIAHASSPEGQVTISIGVASLVPGVAQDAEHLVVEVDITLYAAKRRGRNTVVAHGAIVLAEAS
jgi:diguanylate cyclase (GGDEF)-like protein